MHSARRRREPRWQRLVEVRMIKRWRMELMIMVLPMLRIERRKMMTSFSDSLQGRVI
jgi:hypothetical protein